MKVPVKYRTISASMEVTDTNDHIEKHWIAGNFYEAGRIGMLHDVYERCQGMTFVDIGAHRGNHSVFFAAACNAKQVTSFEPNPENFRILQINTAAYPQIECYQAAVGMKAGSVESVSGPAGNSGMASVKEAQDGVKMVNLDAVVIGGKVDVLKIDTEGMGMDVLQGAFATIQKYKPIIYIEAADIAELNAINAYLSSLGYRYSGLKFNATPTYLFLP